MSWLIYWQTLFFHRYIVIICCTYAHQCKYMLECVCVCVWQKYFTLLYNISSHLVCSRSQRHLESARCAGIKFWWHSHRSIHVRPMRRVSLRNQLAFLPHFASCKPLVDASNCLAYISAWRARAKCIKQQKEAEKKANETYCLKAQRITGDGKNAVCH